MNDFISQNFEFFCLILQKLSLSRLENKPDNLIRFLLFSNAHDTCITLRNFGNFCVKDVKSWNSLNTVEDVKSASSTF